MNLAVLHHLVTCRALATTCPQNHHNFAKFSDATENELISRTDLHSFGTPPETGCRGGVTFTQQTNPEGVGDFRYNFVRLEGQPLGFGGRVDCIKVGVDVPDATVMIIEHAERFGLAQLHQLRGRVGRGSGESHCLLLYHPPLGELSKQRLAVMRHSNDGFFIAEEDLKIRGPGELLGSKQSGALQFKIADLIRDAHMLSEVKTTSDALFKSDPEKVDKIIRRWTFIPDQLSQV